MPACSKTAQNSIEAMKKTATAAKRRLSMPELRANQTTAAAGTSSRNARSHWKRGSSDSTVSPMTANVPAMTSRLLVHVAVTSAGGRPTSASSSRRRTKMTSPNVMPTPAAAKPQCQLCAGSKPWAASQSLNIELCARKPVTSGAKNAPRLTPM